jgi:hypothetical protein
MQKGRIQNPRKRKKAENLLAVQLGTETDLVGMTRERELDENL